MRNISFIKLSLLVSVMVLSCGLAAAQTTVFSYQGKLPVSITPATGGFEMEFRLFDAAAGGSQIGGTVSLSNVEVKNGSFSVLLDFGAEAFSGADRFIEIGVRRQGYAEQFEVIATRSQVLSVPYAIRALSAATADTFSGDCQGCITDAQIQSVDGSKVTGTVANATNAVNAQNATNATNATNAVNATNAANADTLDGIDSSAFVQTNTTDFIRNQTTQQAAYFNINGTGKANIFDATTQFNFGGARVFFLSGFANTNTVIGNHAGLQNPTGSFNSFFGNAAGRDTTTGENNSFFGSGSGSNNQIGNDNSFFGRNAGFANTTAVNNSFFGSFSGAANTTGNDNSFFGRSAGFANTAGVNNSFFGSFSGAANTTGTYNSFFGKESGRDNQTGNHNTFVGTGAGLENTTGNGNSFFGFLTGYQNRTGEYNSFFGHDAGVNNFTGDNNTFIGALANPAAPNLTFATAIGAGAFVNSSNTIALGRADGSDKVVIYGLGAAGSTDLCRNASNEISTCSSSLRYKTGVQNFTGGLNIVRRLRPVAFNWINGGTLDVGFAAEEVNKIEPLLTTTNSSGEIEGVKYGQITTVLVNAVKEQQAQIESQQEQIQKQQTQIRRQQQQIDALKKLVCGANTGAEICKED